jgi:hypothetical protein
VPVTILAQTPESWTDPAPMPWLEILGIFAGIPAGLFLLIIVSVLAPSMIKGGGYRPGLSWWAAPEWFGARPEDPRQAQPAVESTVESTGGSGEQAEEQAVTGGVGARW